MTKSLPPAQTKCVSTADADKGAFSTEFKPSQSDFLMRNTLAPVSTIYQGTYFFVSENYVTKRCKSALAFCHAITTFSVIEEISVEPSAVAFFIRFRLSLHTLLCLKRQKRPGMRAALNKFESTPPSLKHCMEFVLKTLSAEAIKSRSYLSVAGMLEANRRSL
ncbi:unnamed protein product [Clavelina lepadiformis]|uniref:Uncharacterized protein n=1 Tax=Clavelina lepadiformis TaxID=159417 RepID=A0ABP0GPW2_CLALP